MAFSFTGWIFKQFPGYFHQTDSYKDSQGHGLFQRFTTIPEEDLEQHIVPAIAGLIDILNPLITDAKYIPLIAYTMGDMTLVTQEQVNRRLTLFARTLYRVKGTVLSYQMIFNLFGLELTITENLGPEPSRYDSNTWQYYDDDLYYDVSCAGCTEYSITYWHKDDDFDTPVLQPIPPEVEQALQKLICLVEPIDTKLIALTRKTS